MPGSSVRVRYAPSPTGDPHIGNLRTALFNWLFARHHGGSFILRVEDTDQKRYSAGALGKIQESLRWLGLDWDEGPEVGGPHAPYFQSQRLDIYREAAERLVEEGSAYHCYCSPDRLEEMRRSRRGQKGSRGYDGHCRDLSPAERDRLDSQGLVPAVRFRMPREGETAFHDIIRGDVVWRNDLLDDHILFKSDSYPTYHLANVVDDHLMDISHVLRAEEWLSSTPLHVHLYSALGYTPPVFAHLPIILGPDRSKLSKRHGASSALQYRSEGFLPDAMVNFMALLGWSLDDKTEVMSREMLVHSFDADRIVRSAAIFDIEKLQWMNGLYIRQMSTEELADAVLPYLEKDLPGECTPVDRDYLLKLVPLLQERIRTLGGGLDNPGSVAEASSYFFLDNVNPSAEEILNRVREPETAVAALKRGLEIIEGAREFDHEVLEEWFRAAAAEMGLSASRYFGMLRMVLTGRTASPPLFATMEVLGKERCVRRIEGALGTLAKGA